MQMLRNEILCNENQNRTCAVPPPGESWQKVEHHVKPRVAAPTAEGKTAWRFLGPAFAHQLCPPGNWGATRLSDVHWPPSWWRIIKDRYRRASQQKDIFCLEILSGLRQTVTVHDGKGLSPWEKCSQGPSLVLSQLIPDLHLLQR